MERLGRQLYVTYRAMRDRLDEEMRAAGASVPQWIVLKSVGDEPELSQRELARRVLVTGSTLTHHLDRLEADGLIVRTRDLNDRRVIRSSLTEDGKHRRVELDAVAAANDQRLDALLGARDGRTLRRLLEHVERGLEDG